MQRLPVDSITHVLAFCDAHGLAAATAVCREWESIVATPSMAQSQLWAALAAHSWHAAHRLHAPMLHADEDDEGDAADDADLDEAAEEAAGDAALAAMHTAVPPQPQLAPWMPAAIGHRELLLFSTQWPTRVDASTPAVFCRHADQHQMMMRPVIGAGAYMRALDGALANEEARKQKHKQKLEAAAAAAKRRGQNASGAGEAEDDAEMADGAEDDEDSSSDDDDDDDEGEDDEMDSDAEDELLQAVLQDEEAFHALMRERIGADLRQYVEDARVQMAAQRRRALAAGAGRQGQRAAVRASSAATAAAPTEAAPIAASPADSAASASNADAAPAARPGVRRRALANGPSPAQTAAEAAAIAAAEAKVAALDAESKDESDAAQDGADSDADEDADADADGGDLGAEDDDAEVDMDDGLDEDLDAEDEVDDEEEEDEDDDEEGEDGEDFEDYDETSSSDDGELSESEGGAAAAQAERAQVEQAISADLDAEHRVHALFQLGREAAVLPKLADRTRAVAELLQGEEATEIFSLLRQNGLRRLELQQRREKRRAQRLLRDATFELGCLTRPVSADPAQQSEALPPLEQHLVRIAYAGTRTGGDRSVRADVVFPTRIPGHATPFTALCWVTRERWERAVADAATESDMREKVEGDDGKFVKATKLLTESAEAGSAAAAAAAPGLKRKQTASDADAAAASSSSAAPAPKPSARASKRGAEPPKKRKTEPSSASASAGLGSLDSEEEDESEPAQAACASSSSSAELGAFVPVVRLSMLAYFEVLIQKERVHHGSNKSRRGGSRGASAFPVGAEQCVAVGLGSSRFRLHGKQPGWDAHSFGFHSDDGSIFHGSGTASSAYCAGGFGVGDVVGAGLDYATGVVFFTKNGRYLGPAFTAPLVPLSLYPIVGLDAVYDVMLNFGDSFPFAFDVLGYERSTMARLDVPRALGEPDQAQTEDKQHDKKAAAADEDGDEDEGMHQETEEQTAASSSSSASASSSANSRAPVLQLVDAYCAFNKAKWRHLAPSSSP